LRGSRGSSRFTFDHGAVVRGSLSQKRIALILTGGDYGEGTGPILDALGKFYVEAGFLVTGAFLSHAQRRELMQRAAKEGRYGGPHSGQRPLYCAWDESREIADQRGEFKKDLQKNIPDLKQQGALSSGPTFSYRLMNGSIAIKSNGSARWEV
jgi:peptidoglycan/xylan/chitin deacetylase (PgdA/CDA1 family)